MKKQILGLLFCVAIPSVLFAQETEKSKGQLDDYRRNSLATMMIYHPEDSFGVYIYQAFDSIPMPDKYDDHNFGFRVINNDSITGVQKKKAGLIKAKYGKTLSKKEIEKNAKAIEDILNDAQCGKHLVAKWFNLSCNDTSCTFNMELVQQRGQYNASDVDVELAKLKTLGVSTLSDAGEELLNNTFILVNDMTYVTAEEKAAVAKIALSVIGGLFDALTGGDTGSAMAKAGGQIADSFTGFTVKTHSYLFQLQWNEEVSNTFYHMHYPDGSDPNADADKIAAFFADTSTYKVKYVAHEYEFDSKSVIKGKYDRSELVKMVCTRSMDKNIAALQLQYEDFKVKTPIYEILTNEKGKITGYTAKIGLKEGITEKSEFQVIEPRWDPETNRTKYKKVATLKPVKGKIWDNRYNAVTEEAPGSELTATTFKKTGGGEIRKGMLIIEGKYRKVEE